MMKVWMVFALGILGGVAKNHNEEAYSVLCTLLKTAVREWENRGNHHLDPLQTALHRTIFGNESSGEISKLKEQVPGDYKDVVGSRGLWCGKPYEDPNNQRRWPGHSAPHDLVCLCSKGNHGYPQKDDTREKLCGKALRDLGGEEKQGWFEQGSGKPQVEATWTNVTVECLKKDGAETSLQKAMDAFKKKLEQNISGGKHEDEHLLGDGNFGGYPCSGNNQACVMYYNTTGTSEHKPWWVELEKEINKEEERKQQKKREEQKQKKQEAQKQRQTQKKEQSQLPHGPRTAALRSGTPSTEENEQSNTENISTPTATIEEASGTPIIPPCSWFLGALLLI